MKPPKAGGGEEPGEAGERGGGPPGFVGPVPSGTLLSCAATVAMARSGFRWRRGRNPNGAREEHRG
ncbi:hypothetical protein [Rubrobacter indicoceani]|uniref:hypothetical protein n=1 Tax=Rubrobacter indicoceani TaxID=2051957 RepID=UPI0013C4DED7|nr:hypothetical protein [Rubrobacter indicoceani]